MSKDPVDPIALRGRLEQMGEKSRTLIADFLTSLLNAAPKAGMDHSALMSRLSRVLPIDPEKHPSASNPITDKDVARIAMILTGDFNADARTPEDAPHGGKNEDALKLNQDDLAFFWKLTRKVTWPHRELERLADKTNVLLGGVIDKLNDVAMQTGGELLLEGDNTVEVNPKIVRAMTQ
jgi:hypothetical protein